MYHYHITVPVKDNEFTVNQLISTRIKQFNDNCRYLHYDGIDEAGRRFIFVSEEALVYDTELVIRKLFEAEIQIEEISAGDAGKELINKIHMIKTNMADAVYFEEYNKRASYEMDSYEQITGSIDMTRIASEFMSFLETYKQYIDHTIDTKANAKYNIALVTKNDDDINFADHIQLLYGVMSQKGILTEHMIYISSLHEVKYNIRNTGHIEFFHLKPDSIDDYRKYSELNMEKKMLMSVKENDGVQINSEAIVDMCLSMRENKNINIISLTDEEYKSISKIDEFAAAFPHVVVIDNFSEEDKLKIIEKVTGEYGFSFDFTSLTDDSVPESMTVNKIDTAIRKAVQKKLQAGDKNLTIGIRDLEDSINSKDKKSAFGELENLVGLENVKRTINGIAALLKKRGRGAVPGLHMTFLGNPGTGKSTVARIVAKILAEIGITKKDLLVETQRGGLVGIYLGQTAAKTAEVVKSALGGVLFIDEAYALHSGTASHDSYGAEAIATLVKIMEDRRDEFVCIMAGYSEQMNDMLDFNPGLRDRISFHIDFPDYDSNDLFRIFEGFCTGGGYEMSANAKSVLKKEFARIVNTHPKNFSNGRFVRKVYERICIQQALRTDNDIITEADIEAVFADKDIAIFTAHDKVVFGFQHSA